MKFTNTFKNCMFLEKSTKNKQKNIKIKKYKIRQTYVDIYDLFKTHAKITRESQTKYFVPAGPPGPA